MSNVRGFSVRPALRSLLCAAVLACAASCADSGQDVPAPDLSGGKASVRLHVVQIVEKLDSGINKRREGYRQALDLCRRAGMATVALGSGQESLIGTERWQLWKAPGQLAWRRDAWDVVDGGMGAGQLCRFHLRHVGTHEHLDGQRVLTLDLESGVLAENPADPAALSVHAVEPPAAAELDESRVGGYSGPVAQLVSGQPCDEWTSSTGATVCIWTGGHQWGFASGVSGEFSSVAGIDTHRILLRAEPAPDRIGDRLRTMRFDTGEGVTLDGMLPRAGVR